MGNNPSNGKTANDKKKRQKTQKHKVGQALSMIVKFGRFRKLMIFTRSA